MLRDVGAWITGDNMTEVTEAAVRALAAAFGSDNGEGPQRAAAQTGLPPSAGPVPHSD